MNEIDLIFSPLREQRTIETKKVALPNKWTFWENLELKKEQNQPNEPNVVYSKSHINSLFSFDNLIAFWQFWNKYIGADPSQVFYDGKSIKYFFIQQQRITGIYLFKSKIKPIDNDVNNTGGKILSVDYIVNENYENFLIEVNKQWNQLVLSIIGETLIHSEYINGIRLLDLSLEGNDKKNIVYRFEVWVKKELGEEQTKQMKEYLENIFECEEINIKEIIG